MPQGANRQAAPAEKVGPVTFIGPDRVAIGRVKAQAYRVPTDAPESDGTHAWTSTTIVVVEVEAGGQVGLGYTYAHEGAGAVAAGELAEAIEGLDAMDVPRAWTAMIASVRNIGRPGIAACAIAAVDAALWDLKAKLVGLPLAKLIGTHRDRAPIYGSGGFTSYSEGRLTEQLAGWAAAGIKAVKMKVGRDPAADLRRVAAAAKAAGTATLMVDANGGYTRKQALAFAEAFARHGVRWFEEPVSSDDLAGLRLLRDRMPAGMELAAGEYGYDTPYFRRMLEAGAVDVLQVDASRALGLTGFLEAAALAHAHMVPISAHTAPALHLHACLAVPGFRHLEYFHDHARIERMFFDGVAAPVRGALRPDLTRPGLGLELKRADAGRYAL